MYDNESNQRIKAIKLTFTIPSRNDRHIYMLVFLGVITLIWLSSESVYMPMTVGLGVAWSFGIFTVGAMHYFAQKVLSNTLLWGFFVGIGAFIGLGAIGTTFMLMLFKNVQHSHLTPDFPNETILAIVKLAPAWTFSGGLWGLALCFYLLWQQEEDDAI